MKWISDDIGRKYEEWRSRDCIFISAPTGSGKTYFVLNILRPFLIQENRKVLYLVNRRILKDQIEKEIRHIQLETGDIRNPIQVETYQCIEKGICSSEYREDENATYKGFVENKAYENYKEYNYVVCDECHYFLSDSNYNANTALSFRFIQEMFGDKIRIFISATISSVKEYIKRDNLKRHKSRCTSFYEFCPHREISMYERFDLVFTDNGYRYVDERGCYLDADNNSDGYDGQHRYYGDKLERDYGYLDVSVVKNVNEIIDLVNDRVNKGKWLIFVDSIQLGVKLRDELKVDKDKEVVFVDSIYKSDAEGFNEMTQIANKDMQSARILIATAVLDNGINLKDIKLKNMVIMADTETEFIQMLGRKRADGERLKLYIYKYDKNTFVRRRGQVERQLRIITKYLEEFEERIQQDLNQKAIQPKLIDWEEQKKTEWQLIKKNHIRVMRDLVDGRIRYEDAKRVFCTYGGIMYVNLLAYENLRELYLHYKNIIESMSKDGDDAFIREQLSWLGLAEEEVNKIILGQIEVCRGRVIKAFEEQVKKSPVPKDDFTNFKLTIKDDLILLLEQVAEKDKKYNTVEEAIKKNERVISSNNMDYLRCNCNIPFIVNSNGDGTYTVERAKEDIDNQQENV